MVLRALPLHRPQLRRNAAKRREDDQAILIRLLAWFAARGVNATRLSIVSLDSHPEIGRFIGLGNLDSRQLAELFPRRAPVTPAMLEAGRRAWAAFTAPTPEPLASLATASVPELPFLAAAMDRHLRELPSTVNGLSRTEQLALETLAGGAGTPAEAFAAVHDQEAAPWLGDTMFYAIVASLAAARVPLLAVEAAWPDGGDAFACAPMTLTLAGHEVVAGREDAVQLSGTERWVGGVRLSGARAAWRWDEVKRRPVPG